MGNIDNTLVDVRRAFRLLNKFQNNILNIVGYIKDRSIFNDLLGSKLYSKVLNEEDFGNYWGSEIYPKMWGWNFLYGYMYEYFLGEVELDRYKNVVMSVVQVSDDGFAIFNNYQKRREEFDSFAGVQESHSYLVLCADMMQLDREERMVYGNCEPTQFINDFLAEKQDYKICYSYSKKNVFVCKRYEMQCFKNQETTDCVLVDFDDFVSGILKVNLFKNLK